jgi:hypothetical protein
VVTAFTGFVHYDVALDWPNLQFWFGRPDSLVALYIRSPRNEGLGSDRLFHILDLVDLDQHRKFVKLQCPGAQWRGRFSGHEEDKRHWTNQIRVILEIDPETAPSAPFFWMIYDDLSDNFDCIMAFSPVSSFVSNLREQSGWLAKEAQFYVPPPPRLLRCSGIGRVQLCAAPLPTSAPQNEARVVLRRFNWAAPETPVLLELTAATWTTTSFEVTRPDEYLELETFSRGGYVLQLLSLDSHLEFAEYEMFATVTAAEGDLPFYVCLDDYASSIFGQRFELIGKVTFNIDQPGNVSFALYVTNELQKPHMVALMFNNDSNDTVASSGLRASCIAVTPNKRGYTVLIFGLYPEAIFQTQPVDLVGRWRLKMFSDVQLSDVLDAVHSNYSEVEGELSEMDESHQINRHVLTGACEAVVVLETAVPLSLTLVSTEDDVPVNSVRGIGFAVLPSVRVPGDKEAVRLIVKGISSEVLTGFAWKLRIFSTGVVNCKEDTAPADKTAAAIAAWEKKRGPVKPPPAKKAETKRGAEVPVLVAPPEIDESVLEEVQGEGVVLTEAQIEALMPAVAEQPDEKAGSGTADAPDPGEDLRDQLTVLTGKMTESWEQYEARRAHVTKLFTPTPPRVEEK